VSKVCIWLSRQELPIHDGYSNVRIVDQIQQAALIPLPKYQELLLLLCQRHQYGMGLLAHYRLVLMLQDYTQAIKG
jgi:hypothetical protein